MVSRGEFILHSPGDIGGATPFSGLYSQKKINKISRLTKVDLLNSMKGLIKISGTNYQFEFELLINPLGFKEECFSELWQAISSIESDSNLHAIDFGFQSVLWPDSSILLQNSEVCGNALMYAFPRRERALQMFKSISFTTPLAVVDNTLWVFYAKENGVTNFDQIIIEEYDSTFSEKYSAVATIPLISYNIFSPDLRKEVGHDYFFMQIKIGQTGIQKEMLEIDKNRLSEVHLLIKVILITYTTNSKLANYTDANVRS